MTDKSIINFVILLLIILVLNCSIFLTAQERTSYIRNNTVGYLVNDQKIAVIGSEDNLEGQLFYLVNVENTEKPIYTGTISPSRGNDNTPFNYNFTCDFSTFKTEGKYKIKLADGTLSYPFVIGALNEYRNALELVLQFFRSQRCGNTDPLLHEPCHLNDANALIDASGGWHDAGDYIKFMITTTYSTIELITAADYAITYGFEKVMSDVSPRNGIPDLFEEARIGLEWILKMTSDYASGNYYYQVSGEEDHEYWRIPESDDITGVVGNPRSLHKGWGGNLLGRSAAALSIASRVFRKIDKEFADYCIERAEALFADRSKYENVQKSIPANFYSESEWLDDMVLGAAELYQTTGRSEYLNYAKENVIKLNGSGISWNGCDYLAYAACLKANIEPAVCRSKMKEILDMAQKKLNEDVFYLSSEYTWGTTALFTADAQKAIMYYYLTSDSSYLSIAAAERDYLLGRNSWGVSFVVGLDAVFPTNLHSQIDSLSGEQKGAVVGGPAEKASWKRTFPTLQIKNDKFKKFQSNVVYYDNRQDYYCNEAALDYASPSVFIFLYNVAVALNCNISHK